MPHDEEIKIRVPLEFKQRFAAAAKSRYKNMSQAARDAIIQYVESIEARNALRESPVQYKVSPVEEMAAADERAKIAELIRMRESQRSADDATPPTPPTPRRSRKPRRRAAGRKK